MTSSITRAITALAKSKELILKTDFETKEVLEKFIRLRPDLNTYDLKQLTEQLDLSIQIIHALLNGVESLLQEALNKD